METYGLSHIQITVRDLERSVGFYRELLGMQILRRLGSHAVMLQTPGGREVFTINANPAHAADAGKMGGIAHFGFRLRAKADMTSILERAERAGGKALEQGTRGQGDDQELYAFAADPDGYEVEIFWAPPTADLQQPA